MIFALCSSDKAFRQEIFQRGTEAFDSLFFGSYKNSHNLSYGLELIFSATSLPAVILTSSLKAMKTGDMAPSQCIHTEKQHDNFFLNCFFEMDDICK